MMNKIQIFSTFLAFLLSVMLANAQTQSEVIPVSGNCGMCKANIEKAAKKAGVSFAEWNKDTKMLTVKYNSKSTDATKIQQAVADAGYDTRDIRGNDEAYQKLEPCCHYDRTKTYSNEKAVVSNKNKGGDLSCCEKSDKPCCKEKLAKAKAGEKMVCKNDDKGKACCDKK